MAKTTKAGGKDSLSKKGSESATHLQTSKSERAAPDKKDTGKSSKK